MANNVRRAIQKFRKAIIERVEIDGGHSIFIIGKNVSFINDTIYYYPEEEVCVNFVNSISDYINWDGNFHGI